MALMNFVDRTLPSVSAAWLNALDVIKFTIFADATTKAAARAALTSDAPWTVAQGGTNATTAAQAVVNLGAAALGTDNTFTGKNTTSSAEPRSLMNETDAAADAKLWDWDLNGGVLSLRTRTDVDGAGTTVLSITRSASGTGVSNINFGAPTTQTNYLNTQTSTYTLVLGDAGQTLLMTASGVGKSLTIPTNASVAFPIGTVIDVENNSTAYSITIIPSGGVTCNFWNNTGSPNMTLPNFQKMRLKKIATDTWLATDPVGSIPIQTSGSFTGTLTGMGGATTGTVYYTTNGNVVHLYVTGNITGTSNATSMTLTGLPSNVQPTQAQWGTSINMLDNSTAITGYWRFSAGAYSVVKFSGALTNFTDTGFTAAGTKGLSAGWSMMYMID